MISIRTLPAIVGIPFLLAAVFWTASVEAQMGGQPGCCEDRWDPAKSERGYWGHGKMGPGQHQRMQRHWTFMHQGIAAEFEGANNPVVPTSANLKAGAELYQQNCASCHGPEGMGDGEAGLTLNPSPALVAHLVQRPMAIDGYLLWSISEGGAQFDTEMPAFRESLSREQIWKVILYMRSGLPRITE